MTMRKVVFMGLVVASIYAFFGCSKKTEGGPRLKQVNDALIGAGFKLDSFRPADASRFAAQSCSAGVLDGVETVVCEYSSPDAEAAGKKAGEDWIGQAPTGTVLSNGHTLIALADRGHADPNGKTIHKISQAYRATR
jgi:hypothetical protein